MTSYKTILSPHLPPSSPLSLYLRFIPKWNKGMESASGTILGRMVRKGFLEEMPKQKLGGSKPAQYVKTVCTEETVGQNLWRTESKQHRHLIRVHRSHWLLDGEQTVG